MDRDSILDFWLGERSEGPPDDALVRRWFASDSALDRAIGARFGDAVADALGGGFTAWETDPRDRVALILLLDQFPRNLFRGDRRAFVGDPRAIGLVRGTSPDELDALHPLEHYFAIVPFMHAESVADQRAGEAAFARAARRVSTPFRGLFEAGLDFATRHRVVVERFGRFPHRNAVLGRVSSEPERAFLELNPTGF